ncbi:MAG: sugar ABC transporter ATP-binding protein, partial [Lentisphaeria bacterium]|nr:sugar ABC transporter ATP-binding protein [Lentisphaeria bacterium]
VLNHVETALLFDILRELRDQGVAIVFVSHKLREVKDLCDRVAVLRDGVLTGESAMDGVTPELMANWMVGRELSRKFPPMREVDPAPQVLLEVKDLSVAGVLSGISFELHKGEILGVAGLGGSGRSELAEAIYGLRKRTGGSVLLEGKPLGLTAGDAAESGVILLPEDRQGAGVLLDFSVRENISLTWPKVPIDRKYEKERADFYVEKFSIKTPDIETPVRSLSGGNQQKVAIAKGLELHPKVYLFDEPTRGIDVGARSDVYNFLQELASEGIGVLLISSDLEEIIGMCRRTLVMRGGTLAGILTAPDITESAVMALATGIREED